MSYSIDAVRRAWDQREDRLRREAEPKKPQEDIPATAPYRWVTEAYNDFLIVESPEGKLKVPFVVQVDGSVVFGEETPVIVEYVEMSDLTPAERLELAVGEEGSGSTIVALAGRGRTNVESYVRRSKSGKVVRVRSYWRLLDVSSLAPGDEVRTKWGKTKTVKSVNGPVATMTDGSKVTGKVRAVKKDEKQPSLIERVSGYKTASPFPPAEETAKGMSDSTLLRAYAEAKDGPHDRVGRNLVTVYANELESRGMNPEAAQLGFVEKGNRLWKSDNTWSKASDESLLGAANEYSIRDVTEDVMSFDSYFDLHDELQTRGFVRGKDGKWSLPRQSKDALPVDKTDIAGAKARVREWEAFNAEAERTQESPPIGSDLERLKSVIDAAESGKTLSRSDAEFIRWHAGTYDDYDEETRPLMSDDPKFAYTVNKDTFEERSDAEVQAVLNDPTAGKAAHDAARDVLRERPVPSAGFETTDVTASQIKGNDLIDLDGNVRLVTKVKPQGDSMVLSTTTPRGGDAQDTTVKKTSVLKKLVLGLTAVLLAIGAGHAGEHPEPPDYHPHETISAMEERSRSSDMAANAPFSRRIDAPLRVAEARRTKAEFEDSPDVADRDWDGFSLGNPAPSEAEMKDLSDGDLEWLASNARGEVADAAQRQIIARHYAPKRRSVPAGELNEFTARRLEVESAARRLNDKVGKKPETIATREGGEFIEEDIPYIEPGAAGALVDKVTTEGGFTFDPRYSRYAEHGYAVAVPGNSKIIKDEDFTGETAVNAILEYLDEHADELDANPRLHLGGWHDTEHGEVVLDLSEIFEDQREAMAAGAARNEQAIFDLDTFTEIPTGGTGGREDYLGLANDSPSLSLTPFYMWEEASDG